jgi:hypothetical protein
MRRCKITFQIGRRRWSMSSSSQASSSPGSRNWAHVPSSFNAGRSATRVHVIVLRPVGVTHVNTEFSFAVAILAAVTVGANS